MLGITDGGTRHSETVTGMLWPFYPNWRDLGEMFPRMLIFRSPPPPPSLAKRPFWGTAFLRRWCQIWTVFHFFAPRNNNFFTEQGRQPCLRPPTWRTKSLCLCPPVTGWPSYTPSHCVPFPSPLRLAGLRWRYSNPPPHEEDFISTLRSMFSPPPQKSAPRFIHITKNKRKIIL
jgi:hypothetical protein